jgi:AraC family transcriptional regulator of adaptative response/methylated-DNA-[protein]-cysteine methyltransferase
MMTDTPQPFYQTQIDTPLGGMLAVADDEGLVMLEFADRPGLDRQIERLAVKTHAPILAGTAEPIRSIVRELEAYFEGSLTEFQTKFHLGGTPFQRQAWRQLMRIPYGETRSYTAEAAAIGKPTACRAVANANGANQLAIVIPCHRIIQINGALGGYAGGVMRKQWLINHERKYAQF